MDCFFLWGFLFLIFLILMFKLIFLIIFLLSFFLIFLYFTLLLLFSDLVITPVCKFVFVVFVVVVVDDGEGFVEPKFSRKGLKIAGFAVLNETVSVGWYGRTQGAG